MFFFFQVLRFKCLIGPKHATELLYYKLLGFLFCYLCAKPLPAQEHAIVNGGLMEFGSVPPAMPPSHGNNPHHKHLYIKYIYGLESAIFQELKPQICLDT